MSKPLPWSPSGLEQFVNCPSQFHAVRVTKEIPNTETEQQLWGKYVHKAFEDCQAGEVISGDALMGPLPEDLSIHTPFMVKLWDKLGMHFTELKGGFDKKAQACSFEDKDVWCRLVIDYIKIDNDTKSGIIVDYKTGRPHSKFKQLYLYALYGFALFPQIDLFNVQFYWTKTQETTKKVIGRDEIARLWGEFIPDLKQYKQAFDLDVWQPRPSGLCYGHCPKQDCDHWKPKKR